MSLTLLNEPFALRKLLTDTQYHTSKCGIKAPLDRAHEPKLCETLDTLAAALAKDPDALLVDTYTAAERAADWKALVKKEVLKDGAILPLDSRSRPGHKILDHAMRHFWDVQTWKGVSVRSLCTQESLRAALESNVKMHSTPYKSEIRRMLVMRGGLGNVTKYRTVTAKAIVSYFKATRVLDPCIGWGGRMLGALAAGASYDGCEPDPKTVAGLRACLQDLPADIRAKATLYQEGAETRVPLLDQVYDLVLTSPPYYNLELYTGGTQSTMGRTWDSWVKEWLTPVIRACLGRLREGGTSCWSVKNFRSDRTYPLADVVRQIHEAQGWHLVKTVTLKGSARPGIARIQDGKETRDSEEETFCFQKRREG